MSHLSRFVPSFSKSTGINKRLSARSVAGAVAAVAVAHFAAPIAEATVTTISASLVATVQPGGPRTGANGTKGYNIEGSANANNSSYGVIDFTSAFVPIGQTATAINSLTLDLFSFPAAFTKDQTPINTYLTTDYTDSINNATPIGSASPLRFNLGVTPGGLDVANPSNSGFTAAGATMFFLGAGTYTSAAAGTLGTYSLNVTGAALTFFLNQITQGLPVRLVQTTTADTGAATLFGSATSAQAIPMLVVDYTSIATPPPPDANTLFWNPGQSNSGPTDGSGAWDTGSTTNWFSPAIPGKTTWRDTGATAANAVFGAGTGAGTATVTLSSNHTAGALTFSAGPTTYTLSGGTITLLGSDRNASVSPSSVIVAQKNATIASNVVLANTLSAPVSVSAGATLMLTGAVSGAALDKTGDGTLVLSNTTNTFDHLQLDGGTVPYSVPGQLGTNGFVANSGTLANTTPVTFTTTVTLNGASVLDTTGGDVTFAGQLQGSGFTKAGPNSLVLNVAAPAFNVFNGVINLNGGAIKVQTSTGSTFFDTALGGSGTTVNINNGAVLEFDNIQQGIPTSFSYPIQALNSGGKLVATGQTALYRGGTPAQGNDIGDSPLRIGNGTSAAPISVTIATSAASDVLTIGDPIKQVNGTAAATFATVNVSGPGTVILPSGIGTSHATSVFAGSWQVNSGILQIGPIRIDSLNGGSDDSNNLSEPLLALGYRNGVYTAGNPITVNNGGTFAIATDAPNPANVQRSQTAAAGAIFIDSAITSPVTLNGGAVASSGSEIDQFAEPTGTPVSAKLGSDFTVTGTGSKVLTHDPAVSNNVGANSISLIGSGGTTWNGNLTVDAGTTSGGVFTINRSYTASPAPVSVTAGSTLTITSGAKLVLKGSVALSDGGHSVAIVDSNAASTFGLDITGTQIIGGLSGAGSTNINSASAMVIDFGAGSAPTAAIKALLTTGYAGGAWNGVGISSTGAAADSSKRTGLGYGIASDLGVTSINGVAIPAHSLIIKDTYYGDSSLDGKVDLGNDFNLFLSGFIGGASGWTFGDYNYDNQVNMADFTLFLDGYAGQGGALGSLEAFIEGSSELSSTQKSQLLSVVPEPSTMGVLTLISAGLIGRRKRRV